MASGKYSIIKGLLLRKMQYKVLKMRIATTIFCVKNNALRHRDFCDFATPVVTICDCLIEQGSPHAVLFKPGKGKKGLQADEVEII